jgi:hypothetical protein
MCPEAQNMKTGPNALGTDENVWGDAKHENGTRCHRNRRKRALGTAENESESAKHENET